MAIDRNKAFEISENGLLFSDGVHFSSGPTTPTHAGLAGDKYFKTSDATFWKLLADGTAWTKFQAFDLPFDPTGSSLVSLQTEAAIKEVTSAVVGGSSPGFTFGRNGAVTKGSFLYCDGSTLSNATGRRVYLNSAYVNRVYVDGSNVNTYTMDVLYHSGGGTGLTLLGSVTVTGAYGGTFTVNWPVPFDKQLCCRVSAASANNGANLVLGCEIRGTL